MAQYSIAEARKNLPAVVNEAAAGADVQLTRRGQPVAVLISLSEYSRLKRKRISFGDAYRQLRDEFPEGTDGIEPGYFDELRDRSLGRDISL